MRRMHGFTLIELMIVVAIVGILSAIALPVYSVYLARVQAVEALTMGSGLQTNISMHYWEHGVFPPAGGPLLNDALLLGGKYIPVGNMTVLPDVGVIEAKFALGANAGTSMKMTPKISVAPGTGNHIIQWTCSGLARASHLPSGCR